MVQPVAGPESEDEPALQAVGCAGRITQVAETGDGRYVLTLTGVARFRIVEELHVDSAFRKCRVDYTEFAADLTPRVGEDEVDRGAVVQALRDFAKANQIKVDWDAIDEAPNEALVNALSMMCPFGAPEKQALLEAPDLRTRAEVLVAITEIELARSSGTPSILQ
jgi:Lon protease-like protein